MSDRTGTPDPDDRLSALLGDVLDTTEGAPPAAVDVAVGLFGLHRLDGAVMELLEDSATTAVVHRGLDRSRVLGFSGAGCRLELDIDAADGHVVGEIDPPGIGAVEIVSGSGSTMIRPDEIGRFRVPLAPSEPRRVLIRLADGTTVMTPLLLL
jgi:hypothetical protein